MSADEAHQNYLKRVVDDGDEAIVIIMNIETHQTISELISAGQRAFHIVSIGPLAVIDDLGPFAQEPLGICVRLPKITQGGEAQQTHGQTW